ncbi:transcription intermediary factor 1-alpha-like isoform X3 [Mytilus californianus]|uniref:transcription intermediary factor 1-alpha-like isoform X3 n=3 Tax=Mytilus californianus TaxID=6549 RepID=UPI002248525F|nr:transcription intermediary factor 1-alpha-like isoform X3 [Mytilus californianus]
MAQSASKSCDICMSGPGRNYCEQCDQWMCENCKTLHLRSKMCRNHTILSGSNINPEEKLFCKEHYENFIFYCIDCDMPICKICSVKKHKKHDMSEINESSQELQAEVKRVIDSKIKSVKTNLGEIEQVTGKYQSDIKEAIRVITEDGKQMKQWIDKKVQALIASLKGKETANQKVFQSIRTGFQNDFEKFQKCQTAFTESQKVADATKLLTHLKKIKSELEVESEKQPPIMPTMKYNKKNITERDIFNLFGDTSFKEIVYSVEQTSKKEIRKQSTKSLYRYGCINCGEETIFEQEPIVRFGQANMCECSSCGYPTLFLFSG